MKRALAALLALWGCSKPIPELHIMTWSDYFAADTIPGFEREFGCKVKIDYMESSETLRAKLERPPSGYDVVFPSDDVLPGFIAAGHLEKLDPAKLPNLKNLMARFRGLAFDPKNEYSVPYMWGTTGIAYNKDKVSPPPDSWAALWDAKWANRVTLLDDAREAFAAAMWRDGIDPALADEASIGKAAARVREIALLAYDSAPKLKLLQGDAWISQCFSGDALQAAAADPKERAAPIGYVIPKEGATLWIDNLCIAKGAREPELAHKFIDYILRASVAAAITNEVRFANPNQPAQALVNKEVLEDPMVYPGEELFNRCRLLSEPPPPLKKKLDDAWTRLKAR